MSDKHDENLDTDKILDDFLNRFENQEVQDYDDIIIPEETDLTLPEPDPVPEIESIKYQQEYQPKKSESYNPDTQIQNSNPQKKKKKKKKKKRKHHRLPGVLILVTLIFGVSIVSSLVIIGYGKDMLGIGKSEQTHVIVVPDGATTEQIALMLKNDGIIKSSEAFTMFANLRSKELGYISGEHFIRPNMPYETLIDELTQIQEEEFGESVEVTFPEGITLIDAANILESNHICDAEDFIFYFNSGGFGIAFEDLLPIDTSLKFQRMEGYLFPDTYFFYENSTPEQVCQKIYYNFDSKMTDERLSRMRELNLSLDELITFASVVQKEAATTDTMTLVASVFWNRLNNSDDFPLLQSDPTSNYANNVVRPNMEYYDQTKVDAYDTYKSPGLPSGPICNPGIEAIDAVLEAYESDYFFFIANINTKQTYFSETIDEHESYQALIEQQHAEEAENE
ncbi:MAG: endolytic transglycosylase MltG [Ruminococcus sp.]|nr:endolytic transglycosylase MltG [Ruminococcus sp.]